MTIEFTGITKEAAAKAAARYFGCDVHSAADSDALTVKDDLGRTLSFEYSDTVRAIVDNPNMDENDYKNRVVIPDVYVDLDRDRLLCLLALLKGCGAIVNELCSMHISIPCPLDQRKAGVYFSEFVKVQADFDKMFSPSAAYTSRYAKYYEFSNDGYEFDDFSDIVTYVESTYASVPNFDELFAGKWAVDFLSAAIFGKIVFKAFNASFKIDDVIKAVKWVTDFADNCEIVYTNGWLDAYTALRS